MRLYNIFHAGYILKRLAQYVYDYRHPEDPWIAPDAVAYCHAYLTRDMKVFEWGSGRSTLWWSKRAKHLTSIEHDPSWHARILGRIKFLNLTNIDYRLIPLEHPESQPAPVTYDVLPKYVSAIFEAPPSSFDLIIVDGHYRQACVLAALDKLKVNGCLLIDNVNWLPIKQWNVPNHWEIVSNSHNVLTQTVIWRKTPSPS